MGRELFVTAKQGNMSLAVRKPAFGISDRFDKLRTAVLETFAKILKFLVMALSVLCILSSEQKDADQTARMLRPERVL